MHDLTFRIAVELLARRDLSFTDPHDRRWLAKPNALWCLAWDEPVIEGDTFEVALEVARRSNLEALGLAPAMVAE